MSNAASLVDGAKKWATYYGAFTTGPESAVLSAPLRVRGAWEANDADALADVFTGNGSLLVGDEQLNGRERIREYMTAAFAGPYRGATLVEEPKEIKFLTQDVALAITEGGVLLDGETEVAAERRSRTTWVVVRRGSDWALLSQQSSPITG
jgi:uncharacterized protein (TIGR02246 family)